MSQLLHPSQLHLGSAIPESSPTTVRPYKDLIEKSKVEDLDRARLESYLSKEEFEKVIIQLKYSYLQDP